MRLLAGMPELAPPILLELSYICSDAWRVTYRGAEGEEHNHHLLCMYIPGQHGHKVTSLSCPLGHAWRAFQLPWARPMLAESCLQCHQQRRPGPKCC